jgi:hypothetical protein
MTLTTRRPFRLFRWPLVLLPRKHAFVRIRTDRIEVEASGPASLWVAAACGAFFGAWGVLVALARR